MKKFLLLIMAVAMMIMILGCQKPQQGEGEMPAPELDVQTMPDELN